MRALITGGGGQLASDLKALLGDDAVALSHAELDITQPDHVIAAFERVQPEIVFNCAAFHNVDVCEREPRLAWETNVRAVRDLARHGVPLVHISTNYVFDGTRPSRTATARWWCAAPGCTGCTAARRRAATSSRG